MNLAFYLNSLAWNKNLSQSTKINETENIKIAVNINQGANQHFENSKGSKMYTK